MDGRRQPFPSLPAGLLGRFDPGAPNNGHRLPLCVALLPSIPPRRCGLKLTASCVGSAMARHLFSRSSTLPS
ncbi:hypothetical protein RB213_003772 [Colletotrichum asianum]